MKTRLAALKRLETLYSVVEEMHSMALQQAAAQVHEAKQQITEQGSQIGEAAHGARHALSKEDHQHWLLAEAQRRLATIQQQQWEAIRCQRESTAAQAKVEYDASRIQREQMKTIVRKSELKEQIDTERKSQAEMDDRFLSRLRWMRLSSLR